EVTPAVEALCDSAKAAHKCRNPTCFYSPTFTSTIVLTSPPSSSHPGLEIAAAPCQSTARQETTSCLPQRTLSTTCLGTRELTAISVSCSFPKNKAATKCILTM